MATVTGLGDASVTIAAAGLLFVCFMATSRRTAVRWLVAVLACGVATASGKLLLYLHAPIAALALGSPSGHVAASVLVYGVLPVVVAGRRDGRAVPLHVGLAVAVIAVIALSRLYLQAHTTADIVAGAAIGAACLAWFLFPVNTQARTDAGMHTARMTVVMCMVGAMSGWRLNLDRMLQAVAGFLLG